MKFLVLFFVVFNLSAVHSLEVTITDENKVQQKREIPSNLPISKVFLNKVGWSCTVHREQSKDPSWTKHRLVCSDVRVGLVYTSLACYRGSDDFSFPSNATVLNLISIRGQHFRLRLDCDKAK